MGVYQGNDFRKVSGGRKRPHRKNRKYELGSFPTMTMLSGISKAEVVRSRGGNRKIRLKRASYANVLDPDSKTYKKVKILRVVETSSNKEYARRSIITKGAVIETEAGLAKVVSRPGQEGVINAILLKK